MTSPSSSPKSKIDNTLSLVGAIGRDVVGGGLIDLSHKDWQVKKEVFLDQVSEEWGADLGRRSDEGRFFGLRHYPPKSERVDFKAGYRIVTTLTVFKDKKGAESKKREDRHESYMVAGETEDSVITGNFTDREVAVMWIEGML